MDSLIKRLGLAVPLVMMIVTVDQWSAATGAADPFTLYGVPVASAARGVGLVIAAAYILYHVREQWRNTSAQARNLRSILASLFVLILVAEVTVIAPYLVAAMRQTATAQMLVSFRPNGAAVGTVLYIFWCVAISVIPLLAVGAASLATVFADASQSAAHNARIAPQSKTDAKTDARIAEFMCPQCGASCASQQALAAHMRWKHSNGHAQAEPVRAEKAE